MSNFIYKLFHSEKFEYFILSIILVGALTVRLYKLNNPIADWHSWRQADTASVTRIYLKEGLNLLYPRYYDISVIQTGYFNPNGYRFVEFPVYNLIHYSIVKAIPSLSIIVAGRLISIFSALLAIVAIFFLGEKYIGKWGGVISAFFYGFIPYNIYFTRVILPDPLAVAAATVSVWLFSEYTDRNKKIYLFLSALSFMVAMLIKPFAIFFSLPIFYLALKKFGIKNIILNIPLLLALDIALVPFFLWRVWENNYPQGIAYYMWAFNGDGIRFRPSFWRWIFGERLGSLILGVWGIIPFSFGILNTKRKNLFIASFLVGVFLYVVIVATANVRHDYYQLFLVPPVALTLGAGTYFLLSTKIFNRFISWSLLTISIGMMFIMGLTQIRGDYNINNYAIVVAGQAADRILPKDAKVIAPYNGDTAFLYQINRYGWPIVDDNIGRMVAKGADYYVTVNKGDADTSHFREIFETVEEKDNYIILNLRKLKATK